MALPETDAIRADHRFALEVDGVVIRDIGEVAGLRTADQDVIELKQNSTDGKYLVRKLPGRPKAGEVTLTRRAGADNSFEKWLTATQLGGPAAGRKGGAIIVYDAAGNTVRRFVLTGVHVKSLASGGADVLTEKLVLAFEEMQPE